MAPPTPAAPAQATALKKARLLVRVETPTGFKVPGFGLEVWSVAGGLKTGAWKDGWKVVTNKQGLHDFGEIAIPASGTWHIKGGMFGFGRDVDDPAWTEGEVTMAVTPTPGKAHDVKLMVRGWADCVVQVATPGGEPVEDVEVEVWAQALAKTKKGVVHFGRLKVVYGDPWERRPWFVKVRKTGWGKPTPAADGFTPGEVQVDYPVKPDEKAVIKVQLATDRADLTVTVKDKSTGKPLPGASVEVWALANGIGTPGERLTDAKGQLHFDDLPLRSGPSNENRWVIKVFKKGFGPPPKSPGDAVPEWPVERAVDKPGPGQHHKVEVVLHPSSADLTVTVVDPSGKPVEDAQVEVVGKHQSNSDKGGKVQVKALPLGTYSLKVRKAGWAPFPAPGKPLVAGEHAQELKFSAAAAVQVKLVETFTLEGAVVSDRTWDHFTSATIPAVTEPLPEVRLELLGKLPGEGALRQLAVGHADVAGSFKFDPAPRGADLAVRITLDQHEGKKLGLIGVNNAITAADTKLETGKAPWSQVAIDPAKLTKDAKVNVGEVKVTHADFAELCDLYRSVHFGWGRVKALTGDVPDRIPIKVPEPPSSWTFVKNQEMHAMRLDYKDRCVLLHEYGHFVEGQLGPSNPNPGYKYNDDKAATHDTDTKEHHEAAWKEAWATFVSCALTDQPVYRDGYDQSITNNLATDVTTVGPHAEGSIREALWRVYKTDGAAFKDIWRAWKDQSRRAVRTALDYHRNWKDLGLPKLAELTAAYKARGMEFHYEYLAGAEAWTCSTPLVFGTNWDEAKRKFSTIEELHGHFGGGGTLAEYKEEFYNRNRYIAGGGAMKGGSTPSDPKVIDGKVYIVPKRVSI